MKWCKLGLVYCPDGSLPWAKSHAMLPTPLLLADGLLRVYVGHANEHIVSRLAYVDVSIDDPTRVLRRPDQPLLEIGEPGTFDDNGVNPCSIVAAGDTLRLYYAGYQLQRKIPYTLFTGMALAESPDGPFRRVSRAPILDRIDGEHFFRAASFVLQENGRWRMWYIGGGGWTGPADALKPLYSMRYIESDDGVLWPGQSVECLVPRGDEIGFGRPFVLRDKDGYRLWYSIRKLAGYSMGYAESVNGLDWTRKDDEAGLDCSASGFDSEMVCYPAIVETPARTLMFYNGNGYGRTGVGVAELVSG